MQRFTVGSTTYLELILIPMIIGATGDIPI
jgi:hypothetical protein